MHAALALACLLTLVGCVGTRASTVHAEEVQPSDLHLVAHPPEACSLCDLYENARVWVVKIHASSGQGSGIVVSRSGLVLTNAHVVGEQGRVDLETSDGFSHTATTLIADPGEDLALLSIDTQGRTWTPVAIEHGTLPPVGSEVYAIGHPLGLGWTITRGIVSGYPWVGGLRMLQTDAPISPGNSGGPLLDSRGHLVGVMTSKLQGEGAENIAFARPMKAVMEFLARAGVGTR